MLWAYRTTSRKPTGESPFALTYGTEAIIPTKIGMAIIRIGILEETRSKAIIKDLDTTNELWEAAADEPKSHLFLVHFSVLFLAIFE